MLFMKQSFLNFDESRLLSVLRCFFLALSNLQSHLCNLGPVSGLGSKSPAFAIHKLYVPSILDLPYWIVDGI